uniref:Carotenoid oxygenase n=1 Tax=Aplanochytrium stocchinoi TaxID=215587 RepID=A0A7S3PMW1_9STRA|mmetsp:Transcript_2255/g.3009  ORF Transcript_2255/g.3009 Transcript_2255/m.3009 type:complete len:525 (+) Transcript_2255:38-1612(+)
MIRKLTKEEIEKVIPPVARGWETQSLEFDFWFERSQITGHVPQDLYGTFLRNGPGLTDVYGTPLKHPIDGDGMVCAITFVNGKVHFRSRYVSTKNHQQEAAAHEMLYDGAMGSRVPEPARKRLLESKQFGMGFRDPAHTNVFYWGGKLLACHEYALPHTLDPSTLETIGPDTLGDKLKKIKALSAHYRYDGVKDLLVVIGFRAAVRNKPSTLLVLEFDREWNCQSEIPLEIEGLNYAHDFLLTRDWYIFHITPFVKTSPELTKLIMQGKTSPGESMKYYKDSKSGMIFVQRGNVQAGKERSFIFMEAEPCHIFHFCNAEQTGSGNDTVIRFGAVCLPKSFNMEWQYKGFLSNTSDAPGVYHDYIADFMTRKLIRTCPAPVADRSCEFPTINPYRHVPAKSSSAPRFVYLMSGQKGIPLPFTDIVKYDTISETTVAWHSDGVVGEPVFFPRLGNASTFYGDEDDGWIITQFYRPSKHETEFLVLDAKRIQDGPVCRLKMGTEKHIPYSFHGTFSPYVFKHPSPSL